MADKEYIVIIELDEFEIIYDDNFTVHFDGYDNETSIERMVEDWISNQYEIVSEFSNFHYQINNNNIEFDITTNEKRYFEFIDSLEEENYLCDYEYDCITADDIPYCTIRNFYSDEDVKISVRLECSFTIESLLEQIL